MSLNLLQLNSNGTPKLLENEIIRYTGPEVDIKLTPQDLEKPESIKFIASSVILTNRRLILLGERNFVLFHEDVLGSYFQLPIFGSNRYRIIFKISNKQQTELNYLYKWELVISFSKGGAVDFNTSFQNVMVDLRNKSSTQEAPPPYTAE